MKYLFFFSMLLLMSSFMMPIEGVDPYKGCCGAEPVLIKVGDNKIFVPNVFTPNGDGINDVFKPFYDPEKIKIEQIIIANADGKPIWKTEKFDPTIPYSAWTGWAGEDSTYTGLFTYTMVISDEKGTSKIFGGSACSAVCNPKIPVTIEDKSKCFFPMQYQADTISKLSPLYLEIDCLKK